MEIHLGKFFFLISNRFKLKASNWHIVAMPKNIHLLTAAVTVITVGTSAVAESIIYGVNSHKVGYIRCHRQDIGILTSDPEST